MIECDTHPAPPPPPRQAPAPALAVTTTSEKVCGLRTYERHPDDLTSDAHARATAAKVKLQSNYSLSLETTNKLTVQNVLCAFRQGINEVRNRFTGGELKRSLAGVQEDRWMREIRRQSRRKSQFLRLRRTKIGLRDFRTVKVICKGVFGEVSVVGS